MAIRLQELVDPAVINERVRDSYAMLVNLIGDLSAIDDLPSETLDRAVEALEAACDLLQRLVPIMTGVPTLPLSTRWEMSFMRRPGPKPGRKPGWKPGRKPGR